LTAQWLYATGKNVDFILGIKESFTQGNDMICFVFKMIIPGLHRVGVGQVPNEDTRNA
jgi:hypothetical protein